MLKLTRDKIAHDLNISPYKVLITYQEDNLIDDSNKYDIVYVFSSDLYKNKFIERLEENRKTINDSLSNRFGVEIKTNIVADLRLYQTIEKRGFLLYKGPVKIECQNKIIIDSNQLKVKI